MRGFIVFALLWAGVMWASRSWLAGSSVLWVFIGAWVAVTLIAALGMTQALICGRNQSGGSHEKGKR